MAHLPPSFFPFVMLVSIDRTKKPARASGSLIMVLAIFSVLSLAGSIDGADENDWIIESDTTVQSTSVSVKGDVIVRSGATLRLLGASLQVGGRIHVDPNATLELGPASGQFTRLSPLNKSRGFWIEVNGSIRSQGLPPSLIEGLSGDGLHSALVADGGIQVHGLGVLADLVVRNGTAGITVQEKGRLAIRDALVRGLGFVGVSGHGHLELDNATVVEHGMGVTGRLTCDIWVRNSFIASYGDNVFLNSCPIRVDSTVFEGGYASFTANGKAAVNITHSEFRGYRLNAVTVAPLPGNNGGVLRPWIRVTDTKFVGGPGAKWGVELASSNSELLRITVQNHTGEGVLMYGGNLLLRDSSFFNNGGYDVLARDGRFTQSGNTFGSAGQGATELGGGLSSTYQFAAIAVDPNGKYVPGGLYVQVRDRSGRAVFERRNLENETLVVEFETYDKGPDGNPEFRGPFTFRAEHPGRKKPMVGEVAGPDYDLYVDLDYPERPSGLVGWLVLFLFAVIMGLLVYGLSGDLVRSTFRRLRHR